MITVIGPIDPQQYWQQCPKILTFFYLVFSVPPLAKGYGTACIPYLTACELISIFIRRATFLVSQIKKKAS